MSAAKRQLPFVLVASGHGTLIVNRNDYRMIDAERGYGVGYDILNTSFYKPDEIGNALYLLTLRREFFGDGVVAIDGGANIGVHTVEWAKMMQGWGRVIAIEAQERIFYALAGNIAINNCLNANALYAAIGATVGTISVPQPDYVKPASFGSLELRPSASNEFIGQTIDYAPERCSEVRLLTIDSLGLDRIDFLKIDIEGMELEAIEGAIGSIQKFMPQIFIETIKTDKQALSRLLDGFGYAQFQLGMNLLAVHQRDPALQKLKP
jgi:FkbM family methyltransferase